MKTWRACVVVLVLSCICLLADILAVLLSDVILLLQEKDQKLLFAAVVSSQVYDPDVSGSSHYIKM